MRFKTNKKNLNSEFQDKNTTPRKKCFKDHRESCIFTQNQWFLGLNELLSLAKGSEGTV